MLRTPRGVSHPAALAAASPGGDECLEEDEDELEPGLDEAEAEPETGSGTKAAGGTRGAVLTRRGITLRVLLRDGLLEPARGVLSIYYLVSPAGVGTRDEDKGPGMGRLGGGPLGTSPIHPLTPQGKKFVGDLGADGTITWQETGQVFNSPSAWATHCKRLVNPAKKSGCGWASVRYKGQKLDQYKAAWLRKHQPNAPPAEEVGWDPLPTPQAQIWDPAAWVVGWVPALCCPQSLASEGEEEEMPEDEEEEATREGRAPMPEPTATKKPEERSKKQQCKNLAEPAGTGRVAFGGAGGVPRDPGQPGSGDGGVVLRRSRPPGEKAGEQTPGARPLLHPGHPRLGQVGYNGTWVPWVPPAAPWVPEGPGAVVVAGLRLFQEPPDPGGGDVLRRHQQVPALQRGHFQQRPPAPGASPPGGGVGDTGWDISDGAGDSCGERGVSLVSFWGQMVDFNFFL